MAIKAVAAGDGLLDGPVLYENGIAGDQTGTGTVCAVDPVPVLDRGEAVAFQGVSTGTAGAGIGAAS